MRIGEVAKISRCPAVTIRYYERIGLLPNAKRTAANYRIYDQNDLERLRFIETLGAPCPDCSDYAKFSHAPSRKGMRAGEG